MERDRRMHTAAVILERPGSLSLGAARQRDMSADDVMVDVLWSGISAGTERLLWSGRMPAFPGMGYPLVPGYESVGVVTAAGSQSNVAVGSHVFVPGATSFPELRCLFGGAARSLVVESRRALPVAADLGDRATMLALAATAHHITPLNAGPPPELIVGHGALGRLLARLTVLAGGPPPVVWETASERRTGAVGYTVIDPKDDDRRSYARICDVSGNTAILDELIARLQPGGEILLAGFYDQPVNFAFAPAFMREARLRVVAQWQPSDLVAVRDLVADGRLSLDGLITHREPADRAPAAYRAAFEDQLCLKMVLDWRELS